ncbi:MAG: molybdopterin-dependent oxidoreductase [Gammaproteobacteria bacterium]|nr:molybdopterin-dependent oxidoreductase [Gammaproteobacteria bacterium]MDH3372545.1 molybdopterin-dependent oxidoreductase [Gammaproteobacteria bacterium]MDH3408290.1 molybdopterin-dependent oxidoreductase [Gammaproteobacteria bacterium]MDH3552075.1 molybdopterin-dependent oxidoreductase [Gammaproteobacteria bacterium]
MSRIEQLSRREFLQRTGKAGGGLVLALTLTSACQPGREDAADASVVAPNVYVNVRDDGVVEIYCHRSEMGQGIRTCLPQIIADEMEANWDRIKLIQALGDEKYGDQNTDGSTSIRQQFDLLRTAGASAREMLIAAAAATWGVPAADCVAREHAIHHAASGKSAGFGDLVSAAADMDVPEDVSFKSPDEYRYIGKSMDIIDGFAMTTGQANYGIDTVLPDMLYASIERCPAVGGTVKSLDDTATKSIAGVTAVLQLPDATSPPLFNPLGGVAVLAENTWAAQQGREALDIEWDYGANAEYDSASYREKLMQTSRDAGRSVLNRGDVEVAFGDAATIHEAEYFAPHLSQAPMEPPAAAARMTDDGGCEVWACTQDPQSAQQTVAGVLGIDKSKVKVNVTLLGGAFGRKSKPDFIAEAAWLAKEAGHPVKVTWTREDDIRHGYLHSVSAQCIKAGLDADGNTTAWRHCTAFPSIGSTFDATATGPSAGELGLGFVDNPYAIPNMRLEAGDATAHLRIGWLRSVCNVYHAFANCSFVDELAYLAGADPKDYLLRLLGPPRHVDPTAEGAEYGNYGQGLDTHPIDTGRIAAVVEEVADMAGWGRELPPGHGLGIAVHRSFLTTVGTVAEVSVSDAGKLVVHELWTAIDAGTVINPDRVKAQMEGAGIFGMSLALHGEITAKGGAVVEGNYDSYPVVRMNEAPAAINVHIMDVDAPPGGVGEPGVPPVAPAIVNAYFAATGNRVRELPLRNAGLA